MRVCSHILAVSQGPQLISRFSDGLIECAPAHRSRLEGISVFPSVCRRAATALSSLWSYSLDLVKNKPFSLRVKPVQSSQRMHNGDVNAVGHVLLAAVDGPGEGV